MRALDYKNISLVPRVVSQMPHRNLADTGVQCLGVRLEIPMVSSPMPDVTEDVMAAKLAILGGMPIIHRFSNFEDSIGHQVALYKNALKLVSDQFHNYESAAVAFKRIGCAIGVTGDYKERFKALYEADCRIFCLDTANGANTQVGEAVSWIRSLKFMSDRPWEDVYIIAGNVATAQGYRYMAECGVDAVRVGIAGGSVCETRTETGIYMPMVTAILECVHERRSIAIKKFTDMSETPELKDKVDVEIKKLPLIIADGGIKEPQDMCKALVVGADLVMCGSAFAGTKESPGSVLNIDGKLYKLYRGAASFSVQKEFNDKEPNYVEGRESLIPYKSGGTTRVVNRYKGGLQSSMSYNNAYDLNEYRKNTYWIEI